MSETAGWYKRTELGMQLIPFMTTDGQVIATGIETLAEMIAVDYEDKGERMFRNKDIIIDFLVELAENLVEKEMNHTQAKTLGMTRKDGPEYEKEKLEAKLRIIHSEMKKCNRSCKRGKKCEEDC